MEWKRIADGIEKVTFQWSARFHRLPRGRTTIGRIPTFVYAWADKYKFFVYRIDNGESVYVGQTQYPIDRLITHMRGQRIERGVWKVTIWSCPTRKEARILEDYQIWHFGTANGHFPDTEPAIAQWAREVLY